MKKNRIVYGVILLVLFWIMVMYSDWKSELAFKVCILIPLLTAIIGYITCRNIKVYFDEKEEYCQKHDSIKKYIMFENRTFCGIPRVEAQITIRDYMGNEQKRTIVANVEKRSVRNFGMDMTFHHYGIMSIQITQIKVYDSFRLFSFRKKLDMETMIFVFPDMENDIQFHMKESSSFEEEDEKEPAASAKRGMNKGEILEVDEYHEGDDVRNIHWKLSSKAENLIVKHYGDDTDETVSVYVDTRVDENKKYGGCDSLLSVLYALVEACCRQQREYRIFSYDGQECIETDLHNILRHIKTGQEKGLSITSLLPERGKQGNSIYLTLEQIDKKTLPENTGYLKVDRNQIRRKKYWLDDTTVVCISEEDEWEEKQNQFFIEPYNDNNRKRKKIRYADQFGYLFFQSIVALAASSIAVYSINDVIYIYQDTLSAIFPVIIFVGIHFFLNWVTCEMENQKKAARLKNSIIFFGYLAIVLAGGVWFVVDGTLEVAGLFQQDILIVGEEDYGFLKFSDENINWLLILVAYAIVDVIYNFCLEFVLMVHILVVVPLMSIALIVGMVPTSFVWFVALFYFPVIFTMSNYLKYNRHRKKKYLSDDYPYTGNNGVWASLTSIVITALALLIAAAITFAGGYQRAEWMIELKSDINEVLEAENLQEGLQKISDMFGNKNELSGSDRGVLDDTQKIAYTGETVLKVTVTDNIGDCFYLKSFAGSNYTGKQWVARSADELQEEWEFLDESFKSSAYEENESRLKEIYNSQTAAFREGLSWKLAKCQYEGSYRVSVGVARYYRMRVESLLSDDSNVYKPYYSLTEKKGGYVYGGDGYEYRSKGVKGSLSEFTGYMLEDSQDIGKFLRTYGEYPQIMGTGETASEIKKLKNLESDYAEYVEENYLDVPDTLTSVMEQFQKVKTVYNGQEVTLTCGDKQYRTLGYEPYIQYVRKYFQNKKFTYNINIVRQNADADFIEEFMARKTGYCIHFASAAVMMFRSMGIPARYAEGFLVKGGESLYYEVPDNAAHAWVEIYQEGLGWIPVEVTPGTEGYVIHQEETTVSQTPSEQESETKNGGETKNTREETTVAGKNQEETTTEAKKQMQPGTRENHGSLYILLLMVLFVTVFLARYQKCCNDNLKKLRSRDERVQAGEAERQLMEIIRLFGIPFTSCATNKEKARVLEEVLISNSITFEEAYEALAVIDKYHYARETSFGKDDARVLKDFLKKYGPEMFRQGKGNEKFMYKYIKCLYLKDK
ncbi:MAG: transglutaminase domain-containing protein [Lachnospiraceae bacterium]|nr:transglutaminase domain-containing protein [Lachnospiraceae bacterium]